MPIELWTISLPDSFEKKPETLYATAEKGLETTWPSLVSLKLNHSQALRVHHHRATPPEADTDRPPTHEAEEKERDTPVGTIDSKHPTATRVPPVGATTATSSATKNETAGTSSTAEHAATTARYTAIKKKTATLNKRTKRAFNQPALHHPLTDTAKVTPPVSNPNRAPQTTST